MRAVTLALVPLLGLLTAVPAAAQPTPAAACTITDPELGELSGLAADADHWYAVNDGGTSVEVFVLGKDCAVQDRITGPTDPYDVEDLARAADGTFWLSDTGDNDKDRDTVALISLTPGGESAVHRLTYPDGPHDTEALLLDGNGVPYLISKSTTGVAGLFRPAGPLASPGPTALELVDTITLTSTDTPGGPVPGFVGSVAVTGGATSHDGAVVALRTYTEVYLYPVTGGDVSAALAGEPVRVPLPNEAQGEAIAFQPDGSLITGSEGVGEPINVVAGATALVAPKPPPATAEPADTSSTAAPEDDGLPMVPAAAVAVVAVAGGYLLFRWVRRRPE